MLVRRLIRLVFCGSILAAPVAAQEPDHSAHRSALVLGSVNFRNSGNRAAQAPLQRGVAWLHNFKYREAADAFREAQQADKSLAIAYWLEALTYSHVLWRTEDLARSRATLLGLGPTPELRLAKANTARERAFGAAVEAFYVNASLTVRTRAYADSLAALAASDTTDLEAAAFASHGALMAWNSASAADRPKLAVTARALALRVFNANPKHPGAAHYLTHIADVDPRAAADLLPFARAYDKIAPDADHALHMPSHVYLPLGLWHDVSLANERAWAASRAEVKRDNASQAILSWHSLEWLQYAYLEEGRWDAARAIIDSARSALDGVEIGPGNADARFAVNVLAFAYGMETGDWSAWPASASDIPAVFAIPTPSTRAFGMTMANAYQASVAAIYSGKDRAPARAAARRLREISDTLPPDGLRPILKRAADQVDALIAGADGDLSREIEMLTALAPTDPASASTPPLYIPVYELLGEALLKANRPAAAAAAFRAAVAARPNRSRALLGLARSLRAAGDRAGADAAYGQLADNWKRADSRARQLISAERGRSPAPRRRR